MRASDGKTFSNISATPANFVLQGGYYNFMSVSSTLSSGNTVGIGAVGPDGSTIIPMIAGATSGTTQSAAAYLPPGTYQFTVSGTVTGIYVAVKRVPFD